MALSKAAPQLVCMGRWSTTGRLAACCAELPLGGVSVVAGAASPRANPTWTISSSPNKGGIDSYPAGIDSYLYAVSCSTATSCKAVGYYENGPRDDFTLIESWNGGAWTIDPSPN